MSFRDQNPGYDYHIPSDPDPTFGTADQGDCSLQEFFSRPIKIQSFSWGTGTTLFEKFNPWKNFFENPRVINRITNYNLLRAKLCVKFVINGNGFHYGRALASYLPLFASDQLTVDRAFFVEDCVEASQRPHVYLDPTNSLGGTICCPFVWYYNALGVPTGDWDSMGEMIIHTLQDLKHANGASDSVTVSVFAWAEDVVLSTPTSDDTIFLSAQAGEYVTQSGVYNKWDDIEYAVEPGTISYHLSTGGATDLAIAPLSGVTTPEKWIVNRYWLAVSSGTAVNDTDLYVQSDGGPTQLTHYESGDGIWLVDAMSSYNEAKVLSGGRIPFVFEQDSGGATGQKLRFHTNANGRSIVSLEVLKVVPQAGEYIPQGECWSKFPCPDCTCQSHCGCCNFESEYQPQADEYGQGMISKPANAIARAAGALKMFPTIAPYAKACELGASAIASIARAFGYSRPVYAGEIMPYKPTFVGNFANCNLPDTSNKLTLDVKAETTVDTRTMGLDGSDEMSIASIATRESYLTQFAWQITDTTEDLLYSLEVCPRIWDPLTVGANKEFHMPACCFASLPFKYWRGTMRYRFQIVASAFHKGRIKVCWDPSKFETNEYNTTYTRVIDIAEERDFTVDIGWGATRSYLPQPTFFQNPGQIHGTTTPINPKTYNNGVLNIYVVNELTVPNSTINNDITILVSVCACDDIEFAEPDDSEISQLTWYAPQAGEYVPQAGEDESPDSTDPATEAAPVGEQVMDKVGADLVTADHTNDIFFGDPVTSIRQLLKRFNFHQVLYSDNTTGFQLVEWNLNNFPLYRGYAVNTIHQATTPVNPTGYNFMRTTYLNYFTPAFACYRGAIRWKYHLVSDDGVTSKQLITVVRNPSPASDVARTQTVLFNDAASDSSKARQMVNAHPTLSEGAYTTAADHNPVVEVELPYYYNYRFMLGKYADMGTVPGVLSNFHKLLWTQETGVATTNRVMAYCAAGDDFTLGWYIGPPIAYAQVDPVAV